MPIKSDKWRTRLFVLVFAIVGIAGPVFAQDKCTDILALAIAGTRVGSITADDAKGCADDALAGIKELITAAKEADQAKDTKFQKDSADHGPFTFKAKDDVNPTILTFRRNAATLRRAFAGWSRLWFSPGGSLRAIVMRTTQNAVLVQGLDASSKASAKATSRATVDMADQELAEAEALVVQLMDSRGMLDPFNALLETYLVPYATTGSTAVPSALTGVNQSNQVKAAGFLNFESEHFQLWNVLDWALGGQFGIGPAQTLVTLNPAPTSPSPTKVHTLYQNAFLWSFNTRLNLPTGRRSELSLPVLRFGQNILLDDSILVGPNGGQSTTLISNGRGRSAFNWEIGPEFRIYPNLLETVEDQKTFLKPSFSFAAGWRADSRFHSYPGSSIDGFANPEKRWFLRGFVTLTAVKERNLANKSPTGPFDVAIGVEWDGVRGKSGGQYGYAVPDGTKIFIDASIDLVKAFSKQGATGQ